ncbi:MAG: hypothetical protein SWY16_00690 [Cyanobacteriota bacterium]|nr:hypothetical protein [Cyanobacteriota bacterium]
MPDRQLLSFLLHPVCTEQPENPNDFFLSACRPIGFKVNARCGDRYTDVFFYPNADRSIC